MSRVHLALPTALPFVNTERIKGGMQGSMRDNPRDRETDKMTDRQEDI